MRRICVLLFALFIASGFSFSQTRLGLVFNGGLDSEFIFSNSVGITFEKQIGIRGYFESALIYDLRKVYFDSYSGSNDDFNPNGLTVQSDFFDDKVYRSLSMKSMSISLGYRFMFSEVWGVAFAYNPSLIFEDKLVYNQYDLLYPDQKPEEMSIVSKNNGFVSTIKIALAISPIKQRLIRIKVGPVYSFYFQELTNNEDIQKHFLRGKVGSNVFTLGGYMEVVVNLVNFKKKKI